MLKEFSVDEVKSVLNLLGLKENKNFIACTECGENNGFDIASCITKENLLVNIFFCQDCEKLSFSVMDNDE